jgi:hypothetical protein
MCGSSLMQLQGLHKAVMHRGSNHVCNLHQGAMPNLGVFGSIWFIRRAKILFEGGVPPLQIKV